MDTRTATTTMRIAQLRAAMLEQDLHGILVPSSDPHLSEYLPERWQGREWLSGFSGSMGTLVVTLEQAALFADMRYWTQAELELAGTGIDLVKIPNGAATHFIDWIAKQLQPGQTLAVDGQVLSLALSHQLRMGLTQASIKLRTDIDLLNSVWEQRPSLPSQPIYEHGQPQAAVTRADKLAGVRAAMSKHGANQHFVSTVDDIAWLFNLRGSDVECNPVFIAHALIGLDSATLFVGAGKIDARVQAALAQDGVQLADYAQAAKALAALKDGSVLLIDPKRVTLGLREAVAKGVRVIDAINPSTLAKSCKTAREAQFVRETMEQDGAAMCEFYAWFEQALGRERITEITVDERLSAARAKRPGFVGLSFNTIAAFGPNGAMPHYRATPASHAVIEGNSLLLIDSGGQYLGGTTDITRVWKIGDISAAQKRDFTLVLKGTMALSRTRFPRGTLSPMLDAIARAPMWEHGIDYGHGTGHGVGYFMNVHEGPQSISKVVPDANMAMEPGMITSIEPGIYRTGQWGVRIENLVLNVAVDTPEQGVFGDMLEFETLTLCPIDTRCIEPSLLRADEIDWLNRYHAEVLARLSPLVSGEALVWLQKRTRPI